MFVYTELVPFASVQAGMLMAPRHNVTVDEPLRVLDYGTDVLMLRVS